jgi:hypothetical protein
MYDGEAPRRVRQHTQLLRGELAVTMERHHTTSPRQLLTRGHAGAPTGGTQDSAATLACTSHKAKLTKLLHSLSETLARENAFNTWCTSFPRVACTEGSVTLCFKAVCFASLFPRRCPGYTYFAVHGAMNDAFVTIQRALVTFVVPKTGYAALLVAVSG